MSLPPNNEQLTPLVFLARSATVFPQREAIREGKRSFTYAEFANQAQWLARSLQKLIAPGERVAYLSPNTPEFLIAHFAIPLAGAILVPLNTRLQSVEVAYILEHSEAKLLMVDAELEETARNAAELLAAPPKILVVPKFEGVRHRQDQIGNEYETLLEDGMQLAPLSWNVADENSVITINYTSGTTGRPKGVMFTHRGAALNSMGFLHHAGFNGETRFLWTLPMFHCNGWGAIWALTAAAGLHISIRAVRDEPVWSAIDGDGVTHLCGAPTVLDIVASATRAHPLNAPLTMIAGGAPPSPAIIERLQSLGVVVTHYYGLTELYGPFTLCEYQSEWSGLTVNERAAKMARQGVIMIQSGDVRVVDQDLVDVPSDGETIGEIVMRGNNVMLGYFKDDEATQAAFAGGWFHSGDLGVRHPDGYIELRDRAKDIIISGGENISSIEVENALLTHTDILDAGVVARDDERWGERPVAFVVAKGKRPDDDELRTYLSGRIARFKVPDRFVWLDQLPRTSTGKVLKVELREAAKNLD